ncbi:unnamed protein product [Pleuronectes platessa]|uniref:Uncharacterized protein n=1 Tax=Pleuronectes platessa TaxID=8262 RepID=A0A9N7YYC7_PLEPL|nr:unnamed protein product [Pleuronectes platessa]
MDVAIKRLHVVFSRFCSPYDIKELFCTALGVPRNTNLSLLDASGAMVSIDPTMPHNTERSPYQVLPMTGGQFAAIPETGGDEEPALSDTEEGSANTGAAARLAKLARSYLCITATSVPSERVFRRLD